jgi:hypothetical protein
MNTGEKVDAPALIFVFETIWTSIFTLEYVCTVLVFGEHLYPCRAVDCGQEQVQGTTAASNYELLSPNPKHCRAVDCGQQQIQVCAATDEHG